MASTPPMKPIVADLWRGAGCSADALDALDLAGADPVLPSSLRVGAAAQSAIATSALAAAEIWRARGGARQRVSVDMRHAAIEFRSERYLRVDGAAPPGLWDAIAGAHRCGDGRWIRLHTNLPHHRDGALTLLACDNDRDAVKRALTDWEAEKFETAAAEAGLVAAMMRSPDEWAAHPQGQAVAGEPLISIEKIADAPPRPLAPASRPLGDVRVLDLTHVIAGPVCGRTLAAHGATVLLITAPHLPVMQTLVVDTGRGKLSAQIDLREPAGDEALRALLGQADVFIQSYRPGALAARGFSPHAMAARCPGLITVSLSAYGHTGPWAGRRGFDSLVQTANGINHMEAEAAGRDRPKALPCQALDHASGYFMAFGAMVCLLRRAEEGGSWHVRVSLARTGEWLKSLGPAAGGLDCADPGFEDVEEFLEVTESGFGQLTGVRHAGQLSETPPHWQHPSVPLGTHGAAWPAATDTG